MMFLAKIFCPRGFVVVPYEPTSIMRRAACKSMSPKKREGKPWVSNSEKHAIRYKAMLDAHTEEGMRKT